jgi:glucokinase
MSLILGSDVGGTKTYLGLFRGDGDTLEPIVIERYISTDFPGAAELLTTFVDHCGQQPDRVVLGVPGPVRHTPVKPVNLPWSIDPEQIARTLGMDRVFLLNDLEATAYGTLALTEEDVIEINRGEMDSIGAKAVIAAGTGLGEGGLAWADGHYVAVPSEGGHASFAPGTQLEAELWRWLFDQHGHVSWERVVSGMGLVNIYEFLRQRCRDSAPDAEPDWLRERLAEQGAGAHTISSAAKEGGVALAGEALALFVSLYGAEAGNLALKMLATGGLYIGGGIAPQIIEELTTGAFMDAFAEKGRVSDVLRRIPVHVIKNDQTALLGAAYFGAHMTQHPYIS